MTETEFDRSIPVSNREQYKWSELCPQSEENLIALHGGLYVGLQVTFLDRDLDMDCGMGLEGPWEILGGTSEEESATWVK